MKYIGRPCNEGRIQLFTKDECNLLGGNWYPNGECLKKEGGSYSWDLRPTFFVTVGLSESSLEFTNVKSVTLIDSTGKIVYSKAGDNTVVSCSKNDIIIAKMELVDSSVEFRALKTLVVKDNSGKVLFEKL